MGVTSRQAAAKYRIVKKLEQELLGHPSLFGRGKVAIGQRIAHCFCAIAKPCGLMFVHPIEQ